MIGLESDKKRRPKFCVNPNKYIQTAIVLFWYRNILGKVTKARAMSFERVFKETVDISSRFKKLGSAAAPQDFGISGSGWWPRSLSLQALEVSTSFQALALAGKLSLASATHRRWLTNPKVASVQLLCSLPGGRAPPLQI